MIIRTKLHPPRVGAETVRRPRLEARLESGRKSPLTLVSAPAGYGKSTLIADWLARSGLPHAWLTVDEEDNELASFLGYLVATISSSDPTACARTGKLLLAATLPSASSLAGQLANDLDELKTEMVLVIDDYHLIQNFEVHQLVGALLRHPPAPLHLVLLGRFDPPLPLEKLRARGQMSEIRETDLRFSRRETTEFFERPEGSPLAEVEVDELRRLTEGWIVGLKMAAFRLRAGASADTVLEELAAGIRHVRRYLLREILEALPAAMKQRLVEGSVLDRISEPLWRVVVSPAARAGETPTSEPWIESALDRGLFMVALDARSEWFRFHQLFRDTLRQELAQQYRPEEIAACHRRAARWLAEHGYNEEALRHYRKAGDDDSAVRVIRRVRTDLMSREQWSRLDHWLRQLPDGVVAHDLELLSTRAWIEEEAYRYPELLATLAEIDELAESIDDPVTLDRTRGEIDALASARQFLACEGPELVLSTQRALAALPAQHLTARAFALGLLALGHQMCGEPGRGEAVILEALRERPLRGTTFEGVLLTTLCFLHFMDADLRRLTRVAGDLIRRAETSGLAKSAGYARYCLGVGLFESGELDPAEQCLEVFLESRFEADLGNSIHGTVVLALVAEAQGRASRADDLAAAASARALAARNADLVTLTQALEAEMALRHGRPAAAAAWARTFEPSTHRLRNRLFQPEIVLVKVLLAESSGPSLDRATRLLADLRGHLEAIHGRRHLIDVLALSALAKFRRGDAAGTEQTLREAIELALPGRVRRPFHDLGAEMQALLGRLELDGEARALANSVSEFGAADRSPSERRPTRRRAHNLPGSDGSTLDRLTDRELEVLSLLAERFSNKEIAARLGISPATIKRHNANIFDKLGVEGGRRAAVTRARSLGMLD